MQIRITVPYRFRCLLGRGSRISRACAFHETCGNGHGYGGQCKSKPNKANFVYQKYSSRSLLDHRLFFNQYKRASRDTNMTATTKAKRTLRLIPPSVYLVFNRHLRVVKPGERVRSTIVFFFCDAKQWSSSWKLSFPYDREIRKHFPTFSAVQFVTTSNLSALYQEISG